MQVAVGPELRGEIANRQSPRPADREQVVAGEAHVPVLVVEHAASAVDDRLDQSHDVRLGDPAAQDAQQDRVIDRSKVLHDVGPQDIAIAAREALQPVDGPVRALGLAVGVAVGNEQPLEARLDDVAQRVVHHPIAEADGADLAPLRVLDVEVNIVARPIAAGEQVPL